MMVLDILLRFVFLPVILFVAVTRALPAMMKDIFSMVRECFGPDLQEARAKIKRALPSGRKRRTPRARLAPGTYITS